MSLIRSSLPGTSVLNLEYGRDRLHDRTQEMTMPLQHDPNFGDPDGVYAALIAAHSGLDDAQSVALNACLVLLLANHIGDPQVVSEAIAAARRSIGQGAS